MHELGIVMNVIKQVEQVAAENGVKQVCRLSMEVGEVSSVSLSAVWVMVARRSS